MDVNLIIIIVAVSLGFFVQTVVGFAAALVAIPILLQVMNLQESVALMSVFFFLFSIVLIYKNWKLIDKNTIKEMVVGIIIGLILGTLILKFGSPLILKKGLGVFVLLYVGYSLLKKKRIAIIQKFGGVLGFLGGIFSGLFGTGGPILVVYILNKLEKSVVMRATIIGALGVTNFLRVPLLIFSGIMTTKTMVLSLYIFPFFLLALFFGHKVYKKVNENVFKNVVMLLLVFSAISLIFG